MSHVDSVFPDEAHLQECKRIRLHAPSQWQLLSKSDTVASCPSSVSLISAITSYADSSEPEESSSMSRVIANILRKRAWSGVWSTLTLPPTKSSAASVGGVERWARTLVATGVEGSWAKGDSPFTWSLDFKVKPSKSLVQPTEDSLRHPSGGDFKAFVGRAGVWKLSRPTGIIFTGLDMFNRLVLGVESKSSTALRLAPNLPETNGVGVRAWEVEGWRASFGWVSKSMTGAILLNLGSLEPFVPGFEVGRGECTSVTSSGCSPFEAMMERQQKRKPTRKF